MIPALRWLMSRIDGIDAARGLSQEAAAEDADRHRFLLTVLERCRIVGIDAAFAQLGPGDADVPVGLRLLALQVMEAGRSGDDTGLTSNGGGGTHETSARYNEASDRHHHDALATALAISVHPEWQEAPMSFRTVVAARIGLILTTAYLERSLTSDDRARIDAAANALLSILDSPPKTPASLPMPRLVRSLLLLGMAIPDGDDQRLLAAAAISAQNAHEALQEGDVDRPPS